MALADHFIDYQWGKTDHKYSGRGGMQFIGTQGGVGDRLLVGREVVVGAHSTDEWSFHNIQAVYWTDCLFEVKIFTLGCYVFF